MAEATPSDFPEPEDVRPDLTDATATELARFIHFIDLDSEAYQELQRAGIEVGNHHFSASMIEVSVSETEKFLYLIDLEERDYWFISEPVSTKHRFFDRFRPQKFKPTQQPMSEADGQALLELLTSTVTKDPRPEY